MPIKDKLNEKLSESSNWILNSPQSLVILMLMGTGIGFLFFGVFSLVSGLIRNWFFMVLFGIFSLFALKKFINISKMVKHLGLKDALGGITANEFVWHKGGVKDGNSGYENDESCDKPDEDRNGKIGKEVRDIYRQSE